MTHRTAWGLLLVVLVIAGGRGVRQKLLLGTDGEWRKPLWLDSYLPALPSEEPQALASLVLADPVDINHCSAETLQALPGIGPILADRILAARAAGVQFACPEDLQKVRGIGPKLAARLTSQLVWPATGRLTPCAPGNSASGDTLP